MSLMRKLVAGVVFATALAGTANAIEVERINIGGTATTPTQVGFTWTGGQNNTTAQAGATNAYKLAKEIKWSAVGTAGPDDGTVNVVYDASTGNFPVGNVIGTLTLSGATFNGAVTGAIFSFNCNPATLPVPNANLSSGGASGSNTVKFILSNLNSCADGNNGIRIAIPVDLGDTSASTLAPASNPTVTFGLEDTASTPANPIPVDGGPKTVQIATIAPAFSVAVTATPNNNNYAALNPTPLFTTLANGAVGAGTAGATAAIGSVQLNIITTGFTDLTGIVDPTHQPDILDVKRFGVLLTSLNAQFEGFSSLTFAGATGGFAMPTAFASNTIELASTGNGSGGTGITALDASTFTGGARTIQLTDANGGARDVAIKATGFTLLPELSLDPASFNSPGDTADVPVLTATTIGSIFRQGTIITFPWFSSGTQAAATGSTSILRIGNLTGTAISAYLSTFDSTVGAAGNVNSKVIAAGVPANGELVMNSAAAEAAAGVNFGRADLQVVLETNPGNVTARRFVFNGASFTELSPGVAGTPQ